MKIVCLGDSLTYGFGLARTQVWPSLLAEATGFEVINKGINGDTTAGMISRFGADVLAEKPDIVIIMGGPNDIFASQTIEGAKANIFSMVHMAAANKILAVVSTLLPIRPERIKENWAAFTDMQRADFLCEQLSQWILLFGKTFNTPVLHLRDFFMEALKKDEAFFWDGLHPNAKGNKLMADFISAEIIKFIKK
jgi:lysophospholipase L1-like esterase